MQRAVVAVVGVRVADDSRIDRWGKVVQKRGERRFYSQGGGKRHRGVYILTEGSEKNGVSPKKSGVR